MTLSEAAFTAIVDAGCTACPSKKLSVEAIVAQKVPLLGGESYGSPSWGYKGEDLVRGTYRIACDGCKTELYAATACSRCEAFNISNSRTGMPVSFLKRSTPALADWLKERSNLPPKS